MSETLPVKLPVLVWYHSVSGHHLYPCNVRVRVGARRKSPEPSETAPSWIVTEPWITFSTKARGNVTF